MMPVDVCRPNRRRARRPPGARGAPAAAGAAAAGRGGGRTGGGPARARPAAASSSPGAAPCSRMRREAIEALGGAHGRAAGHLRDGERLLRRFAVRASGSRAASPRRSPRGSSPRPTSSSPSARRSTTGRRATGRSWLPTRRSCRSTCAPAPWAPTSPWRSPSSPMPRETARALDAELAARGHAAEGLRTPGRAREIAGGVWRAEPYEDASTPEQIDPRTLCLALERLLGPTRRSRSTPGHFMGYPSMYLQVPDARAWLFANGFQAVGLGLGDRDRRGGRAPRPPRPWRPSATAALFMALEELETAVARSALRLLVVVYDDAAYGAEVHHFGPHGPRRRRRSASRTPTSPRSPRAAGAEGLTVRSEADLAPVRAWAADGRGPLVIDAKVNPASPRTGSRRPSASADVPRGARMSVSADAVSSLIDGLAGGAVEVVDLTQPLSETTPVMQLPGAVREHARADPPAAQPLRRARAGLGVGRPGDRRARRHALRRADPLDHGPRRRGRGLRAAGPARRPGGGRRPVRGGRSGSGLSAHGR